MNKFIAGLFLLLSGPLLFAEDFTFNIPYNTYNIPQEIRSLRISCSVVDAKGNQIGFGEKDITIPAGGDSGSRTVQLKFNANAGKKASDGVRYRAVIGEPMGKFIALHPTEPSVTEVLGTIKR